VKTTFGENGSDFDLLEKTAFWKNNIGENRSDFFESLDFGIELCSSEGFLLFSIFQQNVGVFLEFFFEKLM